MRFLLDRPLGGLAKWLRLCGFDTAILRLSIDEAAALPAPVPHTVIISGKETLRRLKRPDLLILTASQPRAQLEEVLRRLRIAPRQLRPLSRCSHCNDLLIPLDRGLAQGRVPEYIWHSHRQFYECPRCRRVFWPGSHLRGITETLEGQLPALAEPSLEVEEGST